MGIDEPHCREVIALGVVVNTNDDLPARAQPPRQRPQLRPRPGVQHHHQVVLITGRLILNQMDRSVGDNIAEPRLHGPHQKDVGAAPPGLHCPRNRQSGAQPITIGLDVSRQQDPAGGFDAPGNLLNAGIGAVLAHIPLNFEPNTFTPAHR